MAEEIERVENNAPVPIRDHFRPVINNHYSGIARQNITANNFELKPTLINMVQQNQFRGAATEDLNLHLRTFLKIAETMKIHGVAEDTIILRLFPFSLRYNARSWLQFLPLGSITTWVDMASKFLAKISVDVATGGSIFSKFPVDAYEMLEQMTINNYQWPSERSMINKPAGIHEVDALTALTAQMTAISTQLDLMSKGNQVSTESASLATAVYPTGGFECVDQAQYVSNRNFTSYRGNPGEGRSSLEDLVGNFISESTKRFERTENMLDNMEKHLTNMGASMKNLEIQIGKLANTLTNQQRGAFLSNTEVNPIEHCKVVTLKSGKEVGIANPTVEETKVEAKQTKVGDINDPVIVYEKPPGPKPVLPYPQRFKKKALDEKFSKFLDIFKKNHINIPFADALEQIPHYEKFMKDVMSRKRMIEKFETIKALGLGEVNPTTITLQLADRSLTYPRGVVEDVLVKVDKFIFSAEFVVLDMEEDQNVPIILGRPFLATGRALIDVHKGELTLRVGSEAATFNIYKTMNYEDEE
ncbi:uncharacterized protein [Henckelia pumila]|uniref:uncharacterized protein n=1 Tax=Henckelia pumila TaxID=405737 RepID=UPI003C6E115B